MPPFVDREPRPDDLHYVGCNANRINRDREGPHGLPPPTPPDIRVTYPAVRQMWVRVRRHPNRSVVSRRASCEFIPGAEIESDTSPDAISPLHCRPPLLSTVQAFSPRARAYDAARLTSAGRSGRIPPPSVLIQDTLPISRGQRSYRPGIDAGCIKHSPIVDGGLCGCVPARPGCTTPRIRFASLAPHVRSTRPSDPTSRRTPGRFPGPSPPRTPGQETCTPKHDRMHGTHCWA